MLSVEDWAEIRRLYRAEGMPIKQVARVMGCSKNTVKRALAAVGPPRYQRRAGGGSIVDANALLRAYIWHCIGIPLVASIFMAVHFWRIRRDGFSGPSL